MLVSYYILESGNTLPQAPKLGAKYTPGKGRTVLEILLRKKDLARRAKARRHWI